MTNYLLQLLLMLQHLRHINLTKPQLTPILLNTFLNTRPRADGGDSFRVNIKVTLRVVLFDVAKIGSVLIFRMVPVQELEIVTQDRIRVSDGSKIALEVLDVHGVEADQRSVSAHVEFSHMRA